MPRLMRSPLNLFRRCLITLGFLAVLCYSVATAQDPYKYTPRILYVVGQPGWDDLDKDGSGRLLQVYSTRDEAEAQAAPKGKQVFRIKRDDLLGTRDGKAWLDRLQANPKEFLTTFIPFSEQGKLEAVVKSSRTGSELGPKNPNFATEGRYPLNHPMKSDYLPDQVQDDFAAGVYYFKSEGPEADFIKDFRVKFVEGPGGEMIVVSAAGNVIDTQKLTSDVAGKALYVMDAAGNFYIIALEWAPIGPLGYRMINHSSIPAGHAVAAAGQIEIHNGKIISIDNGSGHYSPSNKMLTQAIDALQGHGVAKGKYAVSFSKFAGDYPGREYVGLDPEGKAKLARGELGTPPPEEIVTKPAIETPKPVEGDEAKLLKPDVETPIPPLEASKHLEAAPTPDPAPDKHEPKPPPDPAVVDAIKTEMERPKTLAEIDAGFMTKLYQMHPDAATIVGQIIAENPGLTDKSQRMAQVRKQMDLMVWKDILSRKNIKIELTNQGKSNGVRSDLDYTLYHIAREANIPIAELITEHGKVWKAMHGLTPDQVEITVMNGDHFYQDWRNEHLSEAEHQVHVRETLGKLRQGSGTYSVPGAFKEIVHNEAIRKGWTEELFYNPDLDKPEIPIEQQLIVDQGETRQMAERYRDINSQYNHMNVLGTMVQNKAEFFSHTKDGAQDAGRRAKYLNRIINLGLGNLRFFAQDYATIMKSNLPDTKKEEMKRQYLERTLGLLVDDTGKPTIDASTLTDFQRIIDISMKIEQDKESNKAYDDTRRAELFGGYKADAEILVDERTKAQPVTPEERGKLVLAEQEKLFEADQKRVLAEAVLAGLRHSVFRDLTPEGALRNRVRFDPATQKFVMNDLGASERVAFERAAEVVLFFELVNSLPDIEPHKSLKASLKQRALSTAPNQALAGFYQSLDNVTRAEVDKFIAGDPDNPLQRSIDDLLTRQQHEAAELNIKRKLEQIEKVRRRGVVVDPRVIQEGIVREHILNYRMWALSPYRRILFNAAFDALGTRLSGDFKQAFHNNASGLMLASSAVNLIRAWQSGDPRALNYVVFSEVLNYTPEYIQTPYTVLDMVAKVYRGDYRGAVWQGSLFTAQQLVPGFGNAMLAYNVVTGVVDIAHTYAVKKIDVDLVEQAFKSRPRDEQGRPLPENVRARGNRFPDAKESVYNGSGPGFPLFYGRFRNEKGLPETPITVNGEQYSRNEIPHDGLTDEQLADSAGYQFASAINSKLVEERLEPGSPAWRTRAWELKLKYGFDIPFYQRVGRVYHEKYKYLSPFDYVDECRKDVYEWYVQQPRGYKDELAGEGRGLWIFFSDQTDKMQEKIANQCAVIMGSMHELAEKAQGAADQNMKNFKEATARGFEAERGLLAAKTALATRIQADEKTAQAEVERKALELAERHKTFFTMRYPFTYATQEMPPHFEYDIRTIPSKVKGAVQIVLDQELVGMKEGAPGGWLPGKRYEADFKPDANGWVASRPVTYDWRYTAHLLDKDSVEVAQAKLELPVVLYEPSVSGSISVTVYGMTEKGDSSTYSGALVTLEKQTSTTGQYGGTGFGRLKPGSYTVQVAPTTGDARHGPGTGSATIVDVLFSKDPKASSSASIVVKLPYIPEPKIAEKPDDKKPGTVVGGDKAGGKKPGDKGTGGEKSDTAGGPADKKPGGPGSVTTAEEAIAKLAPLTSAAEKARDDAKNSCKYIEAAAAQEQLVAAAKNFIATSFPNGAPAEVQTLADGFDAELAVLKKAAVAQEAANVHLRAGLAAVRARKGEAALSALEAAANTPDIPGCLHEQVMKLYNEIKADIEKRILLIDKAVDAANNKCDFATAQGFGEQVEAEDKTLSWVVNELPKIKDLNRRQKEARTLYNQADVKANEAASHASYGRSAEAKASYDEAIQLYDKAMATAPECDRKNMASLSDLPARKAAVDAPKVDHSLILLLDTSGSMSDNNKMENAKSAATSAVKSVSPTTEVALISYDGGCDGGWRVNLDFTTAKQQVIDAIAKLQPGGGTPTAPAIGFAHGYMQNNARSKSAQILLMTDGQNSCGSMTDAGAGLRNGNIPVRMDAVGFGLESGSKAQTDLGEMVKAAGNGNSYSANSASELIAAFRVAFMTSQVKPNDPFVSGAAGTRLSALFAAAIAALKQNDIRGAMGQFKSAVDQFPASPAAAFNASLAYEAGGQPLQAMNYAKQYLALAPNGFDAGQVRDRIVMLEKEQAANPRAIYAPTDCGTLYRWAQRESRMSGLDAARKAKVYDILTTAQRGDCAAAQGSHDAYVKQYGARP